MSKHFIRNATQADSARGNGSRVILFALFIAAACALITPHAAAQFEGPKFDSCGTIVVDKLYYCYLFQADKDGKIYGIAGLDDFYPGARLSIQGSEFECAHFCTIDGCVEPTSIAYCPECAPADLNCDGVVDVLDLIELINQWGECENPDGCPADLNEDGIVDVLDLIILIDNWG